LSNCWPSLALAAALTEPHTAFIVGLVASPECTAEIRRNRVHLLADQKSSRNVFGAVRH
jgi:regulator of PEP synthase PpsR (kinase-PPPase family)